MKNPFLDAEAVKEAFRGIYLEENYAFLEEDLVRLADGFILAALPAIRSLELNMCVEFVRSLNPEVAQALYDKRVNL